MKIFQFNVQADAIANSRRLTLRRVAYHRQRYCNGRVRQRPARRYRHQWSVHLHKRHECAARPIVGERAKAITPGVTKCLHGRVVDNASKATVRIVDDKLETDVPVAKATTNKSKPLRWTNGWAKSSRPACSSDMTCLMLLWSATYTRARLCMR